MRGSEREATRKRDNGERQRASSLYTDPSSIDAAESFCNTVASDNFCTPTTLPFATPTPSVANASLKTYGGHKGFSEEGSNEGRCKTGHEIGPEGKGRS